jgi:hypothetical protein
MGTYFRCRNSESSADDLGTGRGVVLCRAVATLRSVETHPFAWRIRLVGEMRLQFFKRFWRVVVIPTQVKWVKLCITYLKKESREKSDTYKLLRKFLTCIYVSYVCGDTLKE